MTQSARKALSRFRKLQDKVFNQQVAGCKCCDIMANSFHNGNKEVSCINIYLHKAPKMCHGWSFYGNASENDVEKIFREASEYINYQI